MAAAHIPCLSAPARPELDIDLDWPESEEITTPHLGDCDKVSALVFVPHCTRKQGGTQMYMTLSLHRDSIVHVAFPPRFRETLERLDYPQADWVEGYLEGLARIEWIRRRR